MKEVLAFVKEHQLIFLAVMVAIAALVTVRLIRMAMNRYFIKSAEKMGTDATNYLYIKNIASLLIFTLAALIIIYITPSFRNLAITLLASAGILAAFVGLASQQALSNIISGLFIVVFKPYRVGDIICFASGKEGFVEDITLRHTVVRDFENVRIVVPNSTMGSETIINYNINDDYMCKWVEFGVSYESDIDQAKSLIREEVVAHPMVMKPGSYGTITVPEQVDVRMVSWDDSGVTLRALVWVADARNSWKVRHDLLEAVMRRFIEFNIEIPYPHRTLIQKN